MYTIHFLKAGWQSGHAAACKAVYAGSIPASASIHINDIMFYKIMNFIKLLFTTKNKRLYLFTTVFQAHSYIYVKFFSFNAIIKMLNKIKVSSNQPHYSIDDIELAEKRISKKLTNKC